MKFFLKYLLLISMAIGVALLYLLKTELGHKKLDSLVQNYLSQKTYNKIKVQSLNLEAYPNLVVKLQINDTAKVILKGTVDNYKVNMNYHLIGDSFKFNSFYLKEKIDIQGEFVGTFDNLNITGKGRFIDGFIEYNFIKIPTKIKDLNISIRQVNSRKLLRFLEQKTVVDGLADIEAKFSSFSRYAKQGQVKIDINKATIPQVAKDISFVINSTIDFQNVEYRYRANISSKIGEMRLYNGYYHEGKKIADVDYDVQLKDLSYFKKMLKRKYQGELEIKGTLLYDTHREELIIKGNTKQFGGDLTYLYQKDTLELKLKSLSLEYLLKSFSYPVLLTSSIDGVIKFNILENRMIANTNLRDTRFVKSKFTDMIYKKAEIDMLADVYDKSYFSAGYEMDKLSLTLKIDNGKDYIEIDDATINIVDSKINSNFEIKIQEEDIFGKIYGTLDKPKVWIDKEKFIEYHADKYLGSWLDTNK